MNKLDHHCRATLNTYTCSQLSIRSYICLLQKVMQQYIASHYSLRHHPSEHTGLFISEHEKMGSIGVQVRHRLTNHGFAINITREPEAWFDQVVACGLPGVKAVSVEGSRPRIETLDVNLECKKILEEIGKTFNRPILPLEQANNEVEILNMVQRLEDEAKNAGPWLLKPKILPRI
jgi:lipoyl(octanoyl) transferase 2